MVGEPESALFVEHQVIGANQLFAVALAIENANLASLEVKALNIAALMAGRGWTRDGQAHGIEPFKTAAIIGDIDGPVRTDRGAIGTAADIGDQADRPVGCNPCYRPALNLGQDHRAILHGDRAFRKLQVFGDELNIHGSSSAAASFN